MGTTRMVLALGSLSFSYSKLNPPPTPAPAPPNIYHSSGLYAVFFNSTLYTIAAETFPQHLRGYGTSMAALCQGVTAIWLGQVTPFAFEAITWKYYAVFIGCLVTLSAFYRLLLTETNQLSLELIAGEFGDETYNEDGKTSAQNLAPVLEPEHFVVVPAKRDRASSPETETTRDSPNQGIEMEPMRIF